jgi:hypothetical protein
MDGPVVRAAEQALEAGDPTGLLAFVPEQGEDEVTEAFEAALRIRDEGPAVREVADLHLFETAVRVHRAGEGAPYTGLKPAGLDHGPVIPIAERAIDTGSPEELVALLTGRLEDEVRTRLHHVMELKAAANGDLDANRAYVSAMLDLQVWSHGLYLAAQAGAHGHEHGHEH